ncbi:MAG: phosphomannomutase/phosphoglucomutase [Pseudomonadales bacterium]|nr:phosphomannomutase/phosphoglucomutase [Pseudomonadales bacterium]
MSNYRLTKKIDPVIFRGYDIRGIAGKELNEDVYYTLGRAYATWLSIRRINECVVGHDNRLTSPAFSKAFIAGLNDGGINTFDIGYSLSQIVYFSNYEFTTKGSAMLTASHNPKEYNGLKLSTGYSETMETDEVIAFKEMVFAGDFVEGSGKNKKANIFDSYLKSVLKHFNLKKNWKVVVECCNATGGLFYPEILTEAGCKVIEQNCNLDGNFPLGVPDPTESEVLERLSEGVMKHNADIGFAYDCDGDRMAVVDNNGRVLWMDTIVALFADDTLDTMPGAKIVYNNLCSKAVQETIKKRGGKPVMWVTGHSFIKAKIKEVKAPFGGELSGHIYFTDNFFGHDDAAYASLRLLAYLERKNESLSEAVAKLPQYVSSPEIKLGLADKIKFELIDKKISKDLEKAFPGSSVDKIDGVRIDTKADMVTIRASQNGPYITIKFESKTAEGYEEVKAKVKTILKKYKEIDWKSGVNTSALD